MPKPLKRPTFEQRVELDKLFLAEQRRIYYETMALPQSLSPKPKPVHYPCFDSHIIDAIHRGKTSSFTRPWSAMCSDKVHVVIRADGALAEVWRNARLVILVHRRSHVTRVTLRWKTLREPRNRLLALLVCQTFAPSVKTIRYRFGEVIVVLNDGTRVEPQGHIMEIRE